MLGQYIKKLLTASSFMGCNVAIHLPAELLHQEQTGCISLLEFHY